MTFLIRMLGTIPNVRYMQNGDNLIKVKSLSKAINNA